MAKSYIALNTLGRLQRYDEMEPEWFPNEGDRQWWREQHLIRREEWTLDELKHAVAQYDEWLREGDNEDVAEVVALLLRELERLWNVSHTSLPIDEKSYEAAYLTEYDRLTAPEYDDVAVRIVRRADTKADSQVEWEIVEALKKAFHHGFAVGQEDMRFVQQKLSDLVAEYHRSKRRFVTTKDR
jgi:hypothetical protein